MTANPTGYVPVYDGNNPRSFSGYARAAISGGDLVFASGATGVVSSGADSFAGPADLLVAPTASGMNYIGVATQNAASGAIVSVATRGAVIVKANATITASAVVGVDGHDAVQPAGSVAGNLSHQRIIGRAMTAAASGGYCIVDLR